MAGRKRSTQPRGHRLEMIPVSRLRENDWNPNEMNEDDFEQLVTEVQRLGRVTKPVVIRPCGEYFEIIDGHSFEKIVSWDHGSIVACTAVWAGDVRLIDNMILKISS